MTSILVPEFLITNGILSGDPLNIITNGVVWFMPEQQIIFNDGGDDYGDEWYGPKEKYIDNIGFNFFNNPNMKSVSLEDITKAYYKIINKDDIITNIEHDTIEIKQTPYQFIDPKLYLNDYVLNELNGLLEDKPKLEDVIKITIKIKPRLYKTRPNITFNIRNNVEIKNFTFILD